MRLHYKDQPVNADWGNTLFIVIIVLNTSTAQCWQTQRLYDVVAVGIAL